MNESRRRRQRLSRRRCHRRLRVGIDFGASHEASDCKQWCRRRRQRQRRRLRLRRRQLPLTSVAHQRPPCDRQNNYMIKRASRRCKPRKNNKNTQYKIIKIRKIYIKKNIYIYKYKSITAKPQVKSSIKQTTTTTTRWGKTKERTVFLGIHCAQFASLALVALLLWLLLLFYPTLRVNLTMSCNM